MKYKNKYRIDTTRAQWWNYGWNSLYFVTLITKGRVHWFGEIQMGMDNLPDHRLSSIGKTVESEWLKTFEMRPDMKLWMGEYVVMPDHFHAVIGIGKNQYNSADAVHGGSVKHQSPGNQFGPQSKNLASIIRGFKTGVTKNARKINPNFKWQASYHDIIIRDKKALRNISTYIINNPKKWAENL